MFGHFCQKKLLPRPLKSSPIWSPWSQHRIDLKSLKQKRKRRRRSETFSNLRQKSLSGSIKNVVILKICFKTFQIPDRREQLVRRQVREASPTPFIGKVGVIQSSGCGSVGRVVASDFRGLRFESSHRQKLYLKLTCCQQH